MWTTAIEMIAVQIVMIILLTITWNLHSEIVKKTLSKYKMAANSFLWPITFILLISTSSIYTALVVATTTIMLSYLWLSYKNYMYNRKQDSVIQKGPNITNI